MLFGRPLKEIFFVIASVLESTTSSVRSASLLKNSCFPSRDAAAPWLTFGLTAYATPLREGVPVAGFWGAMATGVQVDVNGTGRFAGRPLTERDPRAQALLEQDPIFGARKPCQPKAAARESRGEWTAPGGFWYCLLYTSPSPRD